MQFLQTILQSAKMILVASPKEEVDLVIEIATKPGEFFCMSTSPLTGIIDEKDVILEFGEFEGESVDNIHRNNPELYEQLVQEKEQDNIAIRRHRDRTFRLYQNPLVVRAI